MHKTKVKLMQTLPQMHEKKIHTGNIHINIFEEMYFNRKSQNITFKNFVLYEHWPDIDQRLKYNM